MSWFYNGIWAVRPTLITDRNDWTAPGNESQWVSEAQGFEDLNITWENMDLFFEDMFSGKENWSTVTFAGSDTTEFYVVGDQISAFYIDPFRIDPATHFYIILP